MMRRVALVALAGLIVVAGAWYGLFLRPERAHLAALRASEAEAEQTVSGLQAQVAVLTAQEKQVPAERKALRALELAVPQGPSLDQLLQTLHAAASRAHVSITSVSTPAPSGWGQTAAQATPIVGTPSIALSVTVAGAPPAVLQFVTALDKSPRLYVVNSFVLQYGSPNSGGIRRASTGSSSTSLSIDAFYADATGSTPVLQLGTSGAAAAPRQG